MEHTDMLRLALSLLAVIGLLLAAARLLHRAQGARRFRHQRIAILDARPLGPPRTHVAVVRIDQTTLVLGITPQQVNLLHSAPASQADWPEAAETPRFSEALARTLNRMRP